MRTRGSRKTHKEQRRKKKKKFVGQRLGVTPKSWLTPKRWLLIWNLKPFAHFLLKLLNISSVEQCSKLLNISTSLWVHF